MHRLADQNLPASGGMAAAGRPILLPKRDGLLWSVEAEVFHQAFDLKKSDDEQVASSGSGGRACNF
tara:strand:- start:402 stop:599 length:198 start_codon:yes stop_codon:yes gene_type:complete